MRDYRAPGAGVGAVLYSLTTSTGMAAVISVAAAAVVFAAIAAGAARFFMRDQGNLEAVFPPPNRQDPHSLR